MLALEQQCAPILLASFKVWCGNKLNSVAHYFSFTIQLFQFIKKKNSVAHNMWNILSFIAPTYLLGM